MGARLEAEVASSLRTLLRRSRKSTDSSSRCCVGCDLGAVPLTTSSAGVFSSAETGAESEAGVACGTLPMACLVGWWSRGAAAWGPVDGGELSEGERSWACSSSRGAEERLLNVLYEHSDFAATQCAQGFSRSHLILRRRHSTQDRAGLRRRCGGRLSIETEDGGTDLRRIAWATSSVITNIENQQERVWKCERGSRGATVSPQERNQCVKVCLVADTAERRT